MIRTYFIRPEDETGKLFLVELAFNDPVKNVFVQTIPFDLTRALSHLQDFMEGDPGATWIIGSEFLSQETLDTMPEWDGW